MKGKHPPKTGKRQYCTECSLYNLYECIQWSCPLSHIHSVLPPLSLSLSLSLIPRGRGRTGALRMLCYWNSPASPPHPPRPPANKQFTFVPNLLYWKHSSHLEAEQFLRVDFVHPPVLTFWSGSLFAGAERVQGRRRDCTRLYGMFNSIPVYIWLGQLAPTRLCDNQKLSKCL